MEDIKSYINSIKRRIEICDICEKQAKDEYQKRGYRIERMTYEVVLKDLEKIIKGVQ